MLHSRRNRIPRALIELRDDCGLRASRWCLAFIRHCGRQAAIPRAARRLPTTRTMPGILESRRFAQDAGSGAGMTGLDAA
jgi:hypothetical protein